MRTDGVSSPSIPATETAASPENRVREKCSEYASFAFYQMLRTMRATVQSSGLLSGGNAEKTFEGMQDMALAKDLSKRIGGQISDAMYRQMIARKDKTPGGKPEKLPALPADLPPKMRNALLHALPSAF